MQNIAKKNMNISLKDSFDKNLNLSDFCSLYVGFAEIWFKDWKNFGNYVLCLFYIEFTIYDIIKAKTGLNI